MLNINFSAFPVLTTERLQLRALKKDDAYQIKELRSDTSVNEFIGRKGSSTLEEAGLFIEKIMKAIERKESMSWAITEKGNRSLIGTICLWNFSLEKEMAEIGYELFPAFQGQGIMQEAVSKVIGFGFEELKLKVITALPDERNTRSIRLLLRNRFRFDQEFEYISKEDSAGLAVYYLSQNDPRDMPE